MTTGHREESRKPRFSNAWTLAVLLVGGQTVRLKTEYPSLEEARAKAGDVILSKDNVAMWLGDEALIQRASIAGVTIHRINQTVWDLEGRADDGR